MVYMVYDCLGGSISHLIRPMTCNPCGACRRVGVLIRRWRSAEIRRQIFGDSALARGVAVLRQKDVIARAASSSKKSLDLQQGENSLRLF